MVFGHRHSREAVRGQLCEVVLPHCFCMGPSAWLRLIDLSGQGLLPTGLSHSLWSHFKRLVLNSFCARSLSLLWLYSPWLSRSLYPSSTALLGKTVQYVPRLSAVSIGSAEPWRSHPCPISWVTLVTFQVQLDSLKSNGITCPAFCSFRLLHYFAGRVTPSQFLSSGQTYFLSSGPSLQQAYLTNPSGTSISPEYPVKLARKTSVQERHLVNIWFTRYYVLGCLCLY